MWFLFGLFTFVAGSVYYYRRRREARWSATGKSTAILRGGDAVGGMRYLEGREHYRNGKIRVLRIGLENVPGYDFRLHAERARDILSKWIGISAEFQVGDSGFDKAVYVVSDDANFHRLLITRPALREHIAHVLQPGDSGYPAAVSIRCRNGRLWAEYRPDRSFQSATATLLARHHLPHLSAIKEHLNAQHDAAPLTSRDRFVLRAILLLSISTGSVVLGAAGMLRFVYGPEKILNSGDLFMQALPYSGLALLTLLAGAVVLLGRSARAHLVIVELALIGGLGFVLSGYSLAKEFNIEWDDGAYSEQVVTVMNKYEKRHRRGRRSYYIEISPPETMSGAVRLKTDWSEYRRLEKGQRVALIVYPGRLGYPWIGAVEPHIDPR